MKLHLVSDWRWVLKKAWSVKFNIAAFLFGGAEILMQIYSDSFPRLILAGLSLLAIGGGLWFRVLAQKEVP